MLLKPTESCATCLPAYCPLNTWMMCLSLLDIFMSLLTFIILYKAS